MIMHMPPCPIPAERAGKIRDRRAVPSFLTYRLCRPALLPWVFDAQQELTRLAFPKPTFQWIEVRQMKCADPTAAVTQQTVRVESWLAIAAGGHTASPVLAGHLS